MEDSDAGPENLTCSSRGPRNVYHLISPLFPSFSIQAPHCHPVFAARSLKALHPPATLSFLSPGFGLVHQAVSLLRILDDLF